MPVNPTGWGGDGVSKVFIAYGENITLVGGNDQKVRFNRYGSKVDRTGMSLLTPTIIQIDYDPIGPDPTTFLNLGYDDTAIAVTASGVRVAPWALVQPV
jgi:hypothetical protein